MILDTLDDPSVPLPPAPLQIEVLGRETTLSDFLFGGQMVARGLVEALAAIGRPIAGFKAVLDLGCGCGRVLRWFQDLAPGTTLHGSDISARAIKWNRAHMPFARFEVNGKEPPLPYPDGAFDLVMAVSVVTHLSEELQFAWLRELARVMRPGGVLLMTVHGDDTSRQRLGAGEDRSAYERKGHHYMKVASGGLHGLPEFYQDAFHTRAYVEREWSRFFAIRAYVRHGPMYSQDLVVLEKAAGGGSAPSYELIDLPFCTIAAPSAASTVTGDELPIYGTSFYPAGGNADVDVRVDGRSLGILPARIESPEVGKEFPDWPSAARSTFEGRLPLGPLAPGPHVLTLHTGGEYRIAASSSYFFTP